MIELNFMCYVALFDISPFIAHAGNSVLLNLRLRIIGFHPANVTRNAKVVF